MNPNAESSEFDQVADNTLINDIERNGVTQMPVLSNSRTSTSNVTSDLPVFDDVEDEEQSGENNDATIHMEIPDNYTIDTRTGTPVKMGPMQSASSRVATTNETSLPQTFETSAKRNTTPSEDTSRPRSTIMPPIMSNTRRDNTSGPRSTIMPPGMSNTRRDNTSGTRSTIMPPGMSNTRRENTSRPRTIMPPRTLGSSNATQMPVIGATQMPVIGNSGATQMPMVRSSMNPNSTGVIGNLDAWNNQTSTYAKPAPTKRGTRKTKSNGKSCEAITKKKTQCTKTAMAGSSYCSIHNPNRPRCNGLTSDGKQCGGIVTKGKMYCASHGGKKSKGEPTYEEFLTMTWCSYKDCMGEIYKNGICKGHYLMNKFNGQQPPSAVQPQRSRNQRPRAVEQPPSAVQPPLSRIDPPSTLRQEQPPSDVQPARTRIEPPQSSQMSRSQMPQRIRSQMPQMSQSEVQPPQFESSNERHDHEEENEFDEDLDYCVGCNQPIYSNGTVCPSKNHNLHDGCECPEEECAYVEDEEDEVSY